MVFFFPVVRPRELDPPRAVVRFRDAVGEDVRVAMPGNLRQNLISTMCHTPNTNAQMSHGVGLSGTMGAVSSPTPEPRRRPSHLMDPEVLRRNYERAEAARMQALREGRPVSTRGETVYVTDRPSSGKGGLTLEQVRRIVIAALVVTTLVHLSAGLAIAGIFVDGTGAAVGLNVAAMATGIFAVVAALLIFERDLRSRWALWLLLGPVPGLVGLWLSLR